MGGAGANGAGDRLVLKVGWRHPEALHEADGLRVWAGHGAVRLVDSAVLVSTTALLLEACDPGTTLAGEAAEEQDEVVAGQLRRPWIEPSPGHPFRPLADMCRWWADEFREEICSSATGSANRSGSCAGRLRLVPGPAGLIRTFGTSVHRPARR